MKPEEELLNRIISTDHLFLMNNCFIYGFECDLLVINHRFYSTEYEFKNSKADFLKDFKKKIFDSQKHNFIKNGNRTNRFYFVVAADIVQEIFPLLPTYAGLFSFSASDSGYYSFDLIKSAPRIHKEKFPQSDLNYLFNKLTWRYYKLLWKTKYE